MCLWHRQVKSGLPHPHAVSPHCRAGQKQAASFSMDLTAAQPCPGMTRDRQTYNPSALARGLCCLLKSLEAGTSLAWAAEGCRQPLEQPSSNLLPLYDTPDSPRGRGCVCCAGTGAQTQLCLVHCPFPEV